MRPPPPSPVPGAPPAGPTIRDRGEGRVAGPVLAGIGLLVLWYAVHGALDPSRRFLVPAPHEVLRAFAAEGPTLAKAALVTSQEALLGLGIAVALSLAMALGLGLSPLMRASLYPYLMILQMTPVIVFAPILVLWVGPGLASVAIITFLICFFPMVVNTTQGLISTDANLVDLFRLCRASTLQEMFLLRLPAALPFFFAGLRIAATLAPIGAIVGDIYAGNAAGGQGGLGYLTILYSARFEMPALFAAAAAGCLLGFAFVAAVVALQGHFLRSWHESVGRGDV
jgi:NitT/TauT family transport system permease protein